jgi:putative transposase
VHWFETVEEAKQRIETWRQDYDESRPHQALAELAPAEFAQRSRNLEIGIQLQAAEN